MADIKYPKNKVKVTPRGVAVFPWLTKPDTKFHAEGLYHTGLALDPSEAGVKEFLDELKEIQKNAAELYKLSTGKKVKLARFTKEEMDQDDNPTGRVLVNAKTYATQSGEKVQLTIVDAKRNPHPNNVPVYGGSTIRLAVRPVTRDVKGELFLTLYIISVQVIDLQTSGGVDGFFDEEEGYEAGQVEEGDESFGDEEEEDDGEDEMY